MNKSLTVEGIQKLFPALRSNFSEIAKLQTLAQKDLTRLAFNSLKMGSEFEKLYHAHREELKKIPKEDKVSWKTVCRTFGYSDEQVRKLRIAHWALGHLTSDDLKTFIHIAGFMNSEEVLAWAAKAKQIGTEAAFLGCVRQPGNWRRVAMMFEKFLELEFKTAGKSVAGTNGAKSRDPFSQIRGMIEGVGAQSCMAEVEKGRFLRDLAAMERFISRHENKK